MTNWIFLGLIGFIFISLIVYEYFDHDCLPHKQCYHRITSPSQDDSTQDIFISLHDMLRSNVDIIFWRQALLVAIGASVLIAIFLYGKPPTPYQFFFIALLIFISVYFILSWMRFHFHSPNTLQIEKGLSLLEERITKTKRGKDGLKK